MKTTSIMEMTLETKTTSKMMMASKITTTLFWRLCLAWAYTTLVMLWSSEISLSTKQPCHVIWFDLQILTLNKIFASTTSQSVYQTTLIHWILFDFKLNCFSSAFGSKHPETGASFFTPRLSFAVCSGLFQNSSPSKGSLLFNSIVHLYRSYFDLK